MPLGQFEMHTERDMDAVEISKALNLDMLGLLSEQLVPS